MALVNIAINTRADSVMNSVSSLPMGGRIGEAIGAGMFGVNFLSGFEGIDTAQGGATFDDVLMALGNIARTGSNMDLTGMTNAISPMRYPGGGLTEQFYADGSAKLALDTVVRTNSGQTAGTSVRDFISICSDLGASMNYVMPSWRYLDTNGLTASDKVEMTSFVKDLLAEALSKGVNIGAIELGNEYWSKVDVGSQKSVRMTPNQYGTIAAQQAEVIQKSISEFMNENSVIISNKSSWTEPKILLQMGSPSDDVYGLGGSKARMDSQSILSAFVTSQQRSAIDGFVTHRYEKSIDFVNDPWVSTRPFHFQALSEMLTGPGWKSFADMSLRVSEWNADQTSGDTGLRSYSMLVAMMGELASHGVDTADFWAVEARSKTPLARFDGGAYSPTAGFAGLSFAGEAFRMMNESLQGKQSLALYGKSGGRLNAFDRNVFDQAAGDNLRTAVEAFSDGHEVVLFVSNLSGVTDMVNLNLSGMIAGNSHFAWASRVGTLGTDPLDRFATPTITNMNLNLTNGQLTNFELKAYETLRLTLTVGNYGSNIMGYTGNDSLFGGNQGDVIDGRDGNDSLWGQLGNDTIYGGAGADLVYGGEGNDSLVGGDGDDDLGGGGGDDVINGGAGNDAAVFYGTTRITVDLAITGAQKTGYGNDVLISIETVKSGSNADRLLGNDQANELFGGAGNDSLVGRGGNDKLYGGAGQDSLFGGRGGDAIFGGEGADQFVFAKDDGVDSVMDFQDNVDKIRLTNPGETFAGLTIAAVTGGVGITHDPGDVILLMGVTLAQITATDFIFG